MQAYMYLLYGQGYFIGNYKTLVESIRHYIRDPSGVFSVCNAREWYNGGISINSRLFCCCFFQNGRRVQGLWSYIIYNNIIII